VTDPLMERALFEAVRARGSISPSPRYHVAFITVFPANTFSITYIVDTANSAIYIVTSCEEEDPFTKYPSLAFIFFLGFFFILIGYLSEVETGVRPSFFSRFVPSVLERLYSGFLASH